MRGLDAETTHDADITLVRGAGAFPEKIAPVQEGADRQVRQLGWIEGDDIGDAEKRRLRLDRGEIVGPGLDIEILGVLLVEIDLHDALEALMPGLGIKIGTRRDAA